MQFLMEVRRCKIPPKLLLKFGGSSCDRRELQSRKNVAYPIACSIGYPMKMKNPASELVVENWRRMKMKKIFSQGGITVLSGTHVIPHFLPRYRLAHPPCD